jgi:death-on-curing protein
MVIPLSENFLKALHRAVLEDDPKAARGYKQESMIDGSMQRALTDVYGYEPFKDVIDKAAALMLAINVFHPFTDGCKRTSLLAVYFFLLFNGYQFTITEDVATLTLKIASREILDERIVANWLKRNCRKNLLLAFYSRFLFSRMYTNLHENQFFLSTIIFPLLEITKSIWPRVR